MQELSAQTVYVKQYFFFSLKLLTENKAVKLWAKPAQEQSEVKKKKGLSWKRCSVGARLQGKR